MADNKKYYYLKLMDDFFDNEDLRLIEDMEDGYLYSNILLKLYLKSIKTNGKLMYKDRMPYTPSMLAVLVGHPVAVVERALEIFCQLGLIETLESGAMYMTEIQSFIGKSSTETDRKREYRKKIAEEKGKSCVSEDCGENSGQSWDNDGTMSQATVGQGWDTNGTGSGQSCDNVPQRLEIRDKRLDIRSSSSSVSSSFDDDDDDDVCLSDVYETVYGKATMQIKNGLAEYGKALGSQLVAAVIQRCAEYGGSGWAYVRTALEDCKARGVTLEQYQLEQIKRASGGATRVDRPEPSGTDILHRDRPLRLKRAE